MVPRPGPHTLPTHGPVFKEAIRLGVALKTPELFEEGLEWERLGTAFFFFGELAQLISLGRLR